MEVFFAEVRNIEDDESKSGRMKIRLYPHGFMDQSDEQNVKDEHLAWAMPLMPSTSPSTNKAGTIPTGAQVGTRGLVVYASGDKDKQYPIWIGSFHRAFPPVTNEKQSDSDKDSFQDVDKREAGVDIPAAGNPDLNDKGRLSPNNKKVSPQKYGVRTV